MVNGAPGAVIFDGGRLIAVMAFTVAGGRIAEVNVLADRVRLGQLELPNLAG